MEIIYLKALLAYPKRASFTNHGLSIDKIEALEKLYNGNKPFPTVIREFLWIAGKDNNLGFTTYRDIFKLQERARENLAQCGFNIERPFFAFDNVTDCESFSFVYLDENQDDPDVYLCEPYEAKYGEPLIRRYKDYTFKSLVEEHIYRLKNGYSLD
jgi:hypothetical protein